MEKREKIIHCIERKGLSNVIIVTEREERMKEQQYLRVFSETTETEKHKFKKHLLKNINHTYSSEKYLTINKEGWSLN